MLIEEKVIITDGITFDLLRLWMQQALLYRNVQVGLLL